MVQIKINGKIYIANAGESLLKECIRLGIDIPYFCYHPALQSVGSCRLCAVKRHHDEDDKKGRIVMSCMEQVVEGMIITTEDDEINEFRASVIESLMTNHPHDCPVCDEGGECHLQDMVVLSGHVYRRYEFNKRTYINQDLGPFIKHEMNRCIQCYRCVRFYNNYAGGKDFGVFGAHNKLYFGRFENGKLESPFSGNLVEVCPTGVFTDKKFNTHYNRKWDLTYAPSICQHCSVGCNVIITQRYNEVRKILNRYNEEVNGFFICDKGRFDYDYINDKNTRLFNPLLNSKAISLDDMIENVSQLLGKSKTIAIGSPRASVEANYILRKLVGEENFYAGVSKIECELTNEVIKQYKSGDYKIYSLKDIEDSEGVLIFGENILKTSPRLALSVRQVTRNKMLKKASKYNIPKFHDSAIRVVNEGEKYPIFAITSEEKYFDDIAQFSLNTSIENTIIFAKALLSILKGESISFDSKIINDANFIIQEIKSLQKISIISGITGGNKELLELCFEIVKELNVINKEAGVYVVLPTVNSMGLGILTDKSAEDAPEADNIIILEEDLVDIYGKEKTREFLSKYKNKILIAHSKSSSTDECNIIIPCATYAESEGTVINAEGRMQRYFSVIPPSKEIRQSWLVLSDIYVKHSGTNTNAIKYDDWLKEISESMSLLKEIVNVAPLSDFRINGMKIPRQPLRYSGRTSVFAHINIHEPKPFEDENSSLTYSMEGTTRNENPALVTYNLKPGWNSAQSVNKLFEDLNNVAKAKSSGIKIWNKK